LSIFDLNAKCRRVHSQQGLDLVIVDYLQLLRHETKGGGGNREQEIAFISRSLKGLAKELSIPVIALAQLSREVEKRANKRPQLSDLRESGSIEQDADMVMFLYRDEYYASMGMDTSEGNKEQQQPDHGIKGLTEVIIAKNRHGSVGSAFAKFVGEYSKFVDLSPYERSALNSKPEYGGSAPATYTATIPSKLNDDDNFYNNSAVMPDPFTSNKGNGNWSNNFNPNIQED
jgi:replicative DNA helicase